MQGIMSSAHHLISTLYLFHPFKFSQNFLNSYYAPCSVPVLEMKAQALRHILLSPNIVYMLVGKQNHKYVIPVRQAF